MRMGVGCRSGLIAVCFCLFVGYRVAWFNGNSNLKVVMGIMISILVAIFFFFLVAY